MTHFAKAFHKRCVERRTINLFLEVNDQPAGVASLVTLAAPAAARCSWNG
jgi:hypothetical protein